MLYHGMQAYSWVLGLNCHEDSDSRCTVALLSDTGKIRISADRDEGECIQGEVTCVLNGKIPLKSNTDSVDVMKQDFNCLCARRTFF